MTIKELYDKAVEDGIEDYEIWICYWDESSPADEYGENIIDNDEKRVIL